MSQKLKKTRSIFIYIAIIGVVGAIIATTIAVIGNYNAEKMRQEDESSSPINTPYPTLVSEVNEVISNSDADRDATAQTLGYANLDELMTAFGIPSEIKPRIGVYPNKGILTVNENEVSGIPQLAEFPSFHFKNVTKCSVAGRQANGSSVIPEGFDGMVKGFTLRLCSE